MKGIKNTKVRRNKVLKSAMKRTLSAFIAFTFVFNLFPSAEVGYLLRKGFELTALAANKDTVPEGTVYSDEQARVTGYYDSDEGYYLLSSVNEVLDYSRAYYSFSAQHQNDVICINFGEGDSTSAINNFLAIGTDSHPFNGTIKLVTNSINTLNIPEAFFDYIYDSATIISETTDKPSPLILTRTMDASGDPVLARHVRHNNNGNGEPKTWQIQIDSYDEENYSVGGFIGEMEDDAQVILDIIDNTSCDTYGTSDIGYVCGKMGEGSSLTVNSIKSSTGNGSEKQIEDATNTNYSVSTINGNAGGVVGSMEESAELIMNCAASNPSASVTAAGTGKYAGGIVGYNAGGIVKSGRVQTGLNENEEPVYANIFKADNKYSIQNTVSGVAGSGGIFGYYRPSFELTKTTFDISWFQIGSSASSRMTANGSGSVGGLFGVLVNEIKTTENGATTYSSGTIEISDKSDNSAIVYLDHSDSNTVTNYGGLVGKYTACDLAGTLQLKDVSVNVDRTSGNYDNFGGAIGIVEGGNGNVDLDSLYVKFDDCNVTVAGGNNVSTSVYGGLVARSANAFIDAKNVTCNSTGNFYGGGVIGRMDDGVLRLSGTTNLTGGYALISNASYYNEGQIVGGRDSSLVFAEKDWVLKRSTACSVDDIGSWGEVLRFNEISTTENGGIITSTDERYSSNTVLTVDETAHTVTISAPTTQTTIGSVADYAMLSLCFQLKATDGLPVLFDDAWSYDYSDIISQDITLGATFSLAGTGLTGLTRDNAETASDTAAHCVYKGKFDGGNNTLTLAIGEPYGQRGNSVLTDHTAQGNGKIYRHIYTGLWGIIDGTYNDSSNYTVKNITLSGTVDINAQIGNFYCGGLASRAIKDFTADNVKTQAVTTTGGTTTGFRMTHSGNKVLYMGGLVGEMGSGANTITVKNSELSGEITGNNGGNADGDEKGASCIGGVIGKISHNKDESRNWTFSSVKLKGTVSNTFHKSTQRIGGLVAEINGSYNANTKHRTLTLDYIEVDGLKVSGVINSAGSAGGLLGYSWLKTDVNITDVTVKNTAAVDIGSATGNAAGIVYRATGHWTVTNLGIQSLKMTATNAASVGAIVNKGYFYSGDGKTFYTAENCSAIYLELPASYTYNLVFNGESINSSAIFDELCAYTCPSGSDILKNGNGIVSIHSGLYTDGSTASGSYHAQTSYGAKPNPNSRYYYNLDTVTKTDTGYSSLTTAQKDALASQIKLMSWGLDQYACTNLKQYFADPFNGTITDLTYNMSGYSWYPVDLDSSITVNGTFTFYNKEFEDSEKIKYNAEAANAYKCTSLYDSANSSNTQHYLMHNGLFHDMNSCTMTVGNVVLSGDVAGYAVPAANISAYSASVCGALVCGTVSGSSSSNVGTIKMGTANNAGISLAGIKVYNVSEAHDNALSVSEYAPLLINKLGSHSTLNLSGISTTDVYNYDSNSDSVNDSSYISATSLIGDAGNSSAFDVNIDFKLVTLDGRNATGKTDNDLSDTSKGNFFAMYNTYNSIFSKATLLNSFSFDSGSSGRYNFTWKQDWDTNNDDTADSSHAGKVTYGKELGYDITNYPKTGTLSSSYYNTQYPDEEFMYSGEGTRYSNPITASDTSHSYWGNTSATNLFVENFLPYVAEKYNAANKKYQLQVNHASKEKSGCGTYNHPYVISTGDDIKDFCYWINNDATDANIRIPTSGLTFDQTDTSKITSINGTWCENHNSDVLCEYNGSYFKCTINNTEYTFEESVLRTYLAGAYYKIADDAAASDLVISSTSTFDGFGKTDNEEYRFRGVIDGNNKTIVNQTSAPFIYYSNGSVVKDLTISVQPTSDIELVGYQKTFDEMWTSVGNNDATGNAAYGGVIARVMGGDTIIDNVSVDYSSMSQSFSLLGKFAQYVPVGGYIGVIVNGGVVFRNMTTAATAYSSAGLSDSLISGSPKTAYKVNGTTYVGGASSYTATNSYLDNMAWLYINPYLGRVINGFAVNETTAYHPYEEGVRNFGSGDKDTDAAVMMQNGTKHYSITDIDSSSTNGVKNDRISIDGNAVTIDSGQDWFLMSLMINSGMDKKLLGYNQDYQVSRSASYSDIGITEGTSTDCDDYNSFAKNDVLSVSTHKSTEYGYLAKAYTSTGTGGKFANNTSLTAELSSDIILPDGYKGIGNLYNNNDNYRGILKTLDGNAHSISQNTTYYYYDEDIVPYSPTTGIDSGLGLLNYASTAGTYQNLFLKGNVKADLVNTNNGQFLTTKTSTQLDNAKYLCAGILIGSTPINATIKNLALTDIDVFGLRNTGGLIGYASAGTLTYTIDKNESYDSDMIKVTGRASTGGLIGKMNAGYVKVDMNDHTFNLTKVSCESTDRGKGNYWDFGVGGFVGMMRAGENSVDAADATESSNYFKNIIIGTAAQAQNVECSKGAQIFTAGVVGIMNKCKGITIEDCDFYNLSVKANFAAAGLVAFPTTYTRAKVINTHLYSPLGSTIESTEDFAGGLIGSSDPRAEISNGSHEFTFDNCSVDNYTLSGKKGAGGIIGFRGSALTHPLHIKNTKVSNCTINSDGFAGGLIGVMNNPIDGYNILATDLAFGPYTTLEEPAEGEEPPTPSYKAGYICGSINTTSEDLDYLNNNEHITNGRTGTTPTIKIAGFSRQDAEAPNTMIAALTGVSNYGGDFGTDGYVVFADYKNKATSAPNDEFANLYSSNDVDVAEEVVGLVPNGSKMITSKYRVAVNSGSSVSINGVEPYEEPVVSESDDLAGSTNPSYEGTKVKYVVNNPTVVDDVNKLAGYGETVDGNVTNGFYIYCVGSDQNNDKRGKKRYGYLTENIVKYDNSGNVVSSGGNGNVIQQTTIIGDACVFYFDKEVKQNAQGVNCEVYHIYKIIMEGEGDERHPVKYYIHVSSTNGQTKYVEFSKIYKDDLIIEGLGTTTENGNTEYKFSFLILDSDRYYLTHSDGGGGVRYYGQQNLNNNGKFVIKAKPDDKTLQAWDYETVTSDGSGNITFSGESASRLPTESEASDFETLCNNSEEKELYYVTKTVSENNPYIHGNNYQPWVTTSPKLDISATQWLTGDGIAYANSISYANSVIGTILSDTSDKKYAKTSINADAKNILTNKLNDLGKYGSYKKQMGAKATSTTDFPVLVLDDATTATNTLVNNYLRYLTNTDYDFAAGNSDVFNVQLGACVWNGASFTYHAGEYRSSTNSNPNTDGAYLYIRNSKFTIANDTDAIRYDNEVGDRFTLIDVQFYDPSDTSNSRKIAYHLYVPVLVKKMLYYDFHASFLSGTNYRVDPYTVKRGNTLIENIGNPVTLEVSWTYDRDLAGWQAALESGDDFYHTTFEKRLKAQNHNNGIPEGTKMVLVDANRKNAHYYANQGASGLWTVSGAYYNFDFSAFTGFTEPTLNDYFVVTATAATSDTEVKFKRVANNESFIVSDGTYYYAIDESGEWELTLSYKNTIATTGDSGNTKDGKIVDDYYITFFTDVSSADKDLYHLEFFDWESFENDKYPTHVSTNDHTHILTGNIFINDNFNINNLKSNTKMSLDSGSDYNDTIQATFSVDVGVNEDIKNDIKTYFNMTSVEVYQSFLIMLNRQDLSSSLQGIATRPDLIKVSNFTIKHGNVLDYTVDTDPDTDAGMTDPYRLTTANYIELRGNKDLRTYMRTASLTAGLTYSISATWELSYTEATKLAAQFPTRDTSNINNTSIGTLIGGSSNMSSTPEAAVYSKNVAKLEDDQHEEITWVSNYAYYCTINTNAKLTLNSDDSDNENGEFYQLGINANDIDPDELTENGYVPMKLKAVYDVSNLSAADTVESMKLTFTVSKKPNYGTALTFADYVDGLNVYSYDAVSNAELPYAALTSGTGVSIDTTTATDKVVYIVDNPDEVFDYDSGSKVYQIPVTFNAIIGDDFGNSKEYANYMIRLEIEIYTKASNADGWATSSIDGSNDDDHVIFTHAKLITSIIE
ncbi:hypothetical protein [uncultured Ruminococcus sp.]|uniref:hypothetical protein n=1 Tax=uncultured Ruminococcus sp. TaxID=165186 RepID=UPI0025E89C08|nr:hypothetical protein [uncultured Ruminococcus sp.]